MTATNAKSRPTAEPAPKPPLHILSLEATNVKRLKAVKIDLTTGVNVIGGRNAAGKSSILDSIWYALGGKSAACDRPVRDGETEAEITLDLGDYVIVRRFKAEGGTTLTVKSADGASYGSPQALLDSLYSSFTFDPLEFSRQAPKQQLDTLKALVGLDLSDLDRKRAELYDERTNWGRDVNRLEGQLAAMPHYAEAPEEEVDPSAILTEMQAALAHNSEITAYGSKVEAMRTEADRRKVELDRAIGHVAQIEQQLALARERAEKFAAEYDEAASKTENATVKLGGMERIDTSDFQSKIDSAHETNQIVRANLLRILTGDDLAAFRVKVAAWTLKIEEVDEEKRSMLAEASFPVAGLSFDENGVLFGGIPFSQASSAEQLRVSVAMGFAMNPRLKTLLIRDGSLLDSDSLRMVAELATENHGQCIIERVGDGAEVGVLIEDGEVAEVRETAVVAA